MINSKDVGALSEIQRLLDEAYAHYFAKSDGHCKSSEGAVTLGFGTYFDRRDGRPGINWVEVYSYVFGDGDRVHTFDSVDEALAAVQKWHAQEMARDYSDEG